MRTTVRVLALLAAPLLMAAGDPDATPQGLAQLEHRFAADAATLGTRGAFLRHMAPSGVIFHPGPVNARLWWEPRPSTPARLAWAPEFAELSASRDLGWTTGPWSYRPDSAAREPVAWGHYLTVWRYHEHEGWMAVVDGGVSHAAVSLQVAAPEMRAIAGDGRRAGAPLSARQSLWKADDEYAKLARREGVSVARRTYGAADLRVMREGALPRVGAADSTAAPEGPARVMSNAQFVSEAADLGYTYGTEVRGEGAAADTSWYLHVWRRAPARRWELAAQVLMPVPKAK